MAKELLTSIGDVEDLSLSIENSRAEAKALVDQHWNEIELLADALLRQKQYQEMRQKSLSM